MSDRKNTAAIVGVGAAACAACCAAPIIGFLTAIGLSTLAGVALFGTAGLAVAAIGLFVVVRRRRRQTTACAPTHASVSVEIPTVRAQP